MSERLGDLSPLERDLVNAAAEGDVLECSQLPIEQLSATDDPKHTVRAELLRELLLKRCDKPPDPRGVRLHRARITGTLDLTHVRAEIGMDLVGCTFDHPVLMKGAHLPWLALTGSSVPALHGDLLQVNGDLSLDEGFRATGHGEVGAVRLLGARITGELSLSGAELTHQAGPALAADKLEVGYGLVLDGCQATGHCESGAVQLFGAHITGPLILRGAKLTNRAGVALHGDGLQVDGDLVFGGGFRATGHGVNGAVRLFGAHIAGQMSMQGAKLTNEAGPALVGDDLQVDGGLFLDKGFEATGHGDLGAVRLFGAHITGQMSMQGAKLTNEAGPALHGEDLRVSAGLICDKRLRAAGHGELGAVRLFGAHITGQLSLRGAKLTNEAGPALHADGLQVDGGLLCDEGFLATGRGVNGAVRLLGAHITGQLSLAGAELINEAGPPLVGDRIQVNGDLLLDEGFRATGYGVGGAVRLLGALITGQLSLRGAELTNEAGLILDLEHADIKQIFLPSVVVCPQGATGKSTCGTTARRVNLSGLVYTSLEDRQWSQWLHLIARHTYGYQPQPYQQLASVRRATGHDADARKILIAQQQDLRERGEIGGFLIKIVHCLWGVLGGYGYRTGRIALALLIAVLAAGGMGFAAGNIPTSPGRYVAMHTAQTDPKDLNASPGPCSLTEQIGVGIDRGLPLSTTGIRSRCDFDTISRRGQAVTWASWVLQFLVWALVTLFVAGYVGLIRKVT